MDKPIASVHAQHAYDAIAQRLHVGSGVRIGLMMGMPMLYDDNKGFAGLYGDAMVFKLSGDIHRAALELPGAELFDPSGRGRPMKAWVRVPVARSASWSDFADDALACLDRGA